MPHSADDPRDADAPELAAAGEDVSDPRAELTTRIISSDPDPDAASAEAPPDGRHLGVLSIHRRLAELIGKVDADPFLVEALRAAQQRLTDSEERYRLQRELGRGGMARVWAVTDEDLGRTVAIKLLEDGIDALPEDLARFVREAQIAGALEHPNIVPIHELGCTAEGQLYIAMRRVDGESLADILRRVRRSLGVTERRTVDDAQAEKDAETEAAYGLRARLRVLLRVCDAISYAHERGVVHRDLKPANVMVGPFGDVVVMDWGVARMLGRGHGETRLESPLDQTPILHTPAERAGAVTQTDSIIGTPAYLAPERITGHEPIGRMAWRADVYSLGAMLYELLTLRAPYPLDDGRAALRLLEAGPPPPPVRDEAGRPTPPGLVEICRTAMAREPGDRYATAEALSDDVRAWLEHRPVTVYSAPLWIRARNWIRRNPSLTVGLAGFALALLILGAAGWIRYEEQKAARFAVEMAKAEAEYELEQRLDAERERNEALRREALRARTDRLRALVAFAPEDRPRSASSVDQRIPIYNQILSFDPADHETRLSLAVTLLQAGDPPAALSEVRFVRDAQPDDPRTNAVFALIAESAANGIHQRDGRSDPTLYENGAQAAQVALHQQQGGDAMARRYLRLLARGPGEPSAVQVAIQKWIAAEEGESPMPIESAYLLRAWYLGSERPLSSKAPAGPFDPIAQQDTPRAAAYRAVMTDAPDAPARIQAALAAGAADPSVWYLAAVASINAGDTDAAIYRLQQAMSAGFAEADWPVLVGNPVWRPVRQHPAFQSWERNDGR